MTSLRYGTGHVRSQNVRVLEFRNVENSGSWDVTCTSSQFTVLVVVVLIYSSHVCREVYK